MGQKGPNGDRGHPTGSTFHKSELWGLAWFCCDNASGLSLCPACAGLASLLLMGSQGLVAGARQIIVFLFLLLDIKRLPRGLTFSSFAVHLMPDVGYLHTKVISDAKIVAGRQDLLFGFVL